ncbi:MAG TPA: NIPSNAP family protein [Opitutaceae bacterium]|nr:NIPSNAP family protein [Opitutaceae bacterium]
MQRRDFLKTSALAASALAAGVKASAAPAKSVAASARECYELRAYHLKPGAPHALLDTYLEKALIPALNGGGIKTVGVFTETDPKDGPAVYVLIPHASVESFVTITVELNTDPTVLQNGSSYLQVTKDNPAFERIDSWFLLAFAGQPTLKLPPYSLEKKARMFEMRTYESFSEVKALKKVEMFNSGEIETMHEVGLAPVFYGQALCGANLPHLTYMLSATDAEAHKKHWDAFRSHPVWVKLKNDPQYADTVSKITSRMLVPTSYSQI